MSTQLSDIQPTSLRGWILKSLAQGEMLPNIAAVLLRPDRTEVNQKDETEYWDYKETIDLRNSIKVAQLAKWVLAFHNGNGGAIIVGVTDKYKVSGIHESLIPDTVRLRNLISRYTSTSIEIFQGQIETHDYAHSKKILWLVFVQKRKKRPIPAAETGPVGADDKPVIQKGVFYIRINDECKACSTPSDFDRLFSDVSFQTLSAYSYDVDEPYFRLLAPHQNHFIGRQRLLDEVKQALDSRGYIISLDGVGGVGKSALAIELVRQLYKSKSYEFIVSLSAKNRIWTSHSEARQANFSGYTELLREIASVLEIDSGVKDVDTLKQNIVAFMQGVKGLLLIDNIEEINDTAVFDFLRNEVPEPVKIIITSRVSRGLPARTISVPGMTEDEALTLLQLELERIGYTNFINEIEDAKTIVKAAGYLPLAIKWAASLAVNSRTLHQVSSQIRKSDSGRREFLDFCFATMYDELSELARDVSLLCPYLHENWNTLTLSIALDQPTQRIERAIHELEDRGILISSHCASFTMLALTADFLSSRWHENKTFREKAQKRITDTFTSEDYDGDPFHWPISERVKVLRNKALILEKQNQFEAALRMIRLALRWEEDASKKAILSFTEGRLIYKSGDLREGIECMLNAYDELPRQDDLADDIVYFAQAALFHGNNGEQDVAMDAIADQIAHATSVYQQLIHEFCMLALQKRKYPLLSRLMNNNRQPEIAFWICEALWPQLDDKQVIFHIGEPLITSLKQSLESGLADQRRQADFSLKANQIEETIASAKMAHSATH